MHELHQRRLRAAQLQSLRQLRLLQAEGTTTVTVLSWDKPAKVMTQEEWRSISADGAPPGVYVPNMSAGDATKWRAKLIGRHGDHPRVEIRKTAGGTQILIVVCADEIAMSMNGTAKLGIADYGDMHRAVAEAQAVIREGQRSAAK